MLVVNRLLSLATIGKTNSDLQVPCNELLAVCTSLARV